MPIEMDGTRELDPIESIFVLIDDFERPENVGRHETPHDRVFHTAHRTEQILFLHRTEFLAVAFREENVTAVTVDVLKFHVEMFDVAGDQFVERMVDAINHGAVVPQQQQIEEKVLPIFVGGEIFAVGEIGVNFHGIHGFENEESISRLIIYVADDVQTLPFQFVRMYDSANDLRLRGGGEFLKVRQKLTGLATCVTMELVE